MSNWIDCDECGKQFVGFDIVCGACKDAMAEMGAEDPAPSAPEFDLDALMRDEWEVQQ